jgi:hypothetical protein
MVAITWLRTLGLPCDGIGDDLPADPATWAALGFLHVPTVVGGSPGIHVPMRAPVVQVDAYTNQPRSVRVPWNKAEDLAGALLAAVQDQQAPVSLTMPAGFFPVRLHSVWAQSEPRRIPSDPADYGRVSTDYEFRWVVLR